MTTHSITNPIQANRNASGGRVASDALRATRTLAEEFAGLEEGADRYALLLLVKRAGKLAGFTPRMIQLLDYYVAYSRDSDWEEGSRPIVFQSLSRTALDLGVSERQVQKLESALFDAGAITWNDSGNHKRYGRRCTDTGRLVYAYGVELTPLAYLADDLRAKLDEKRRRDEAWMGAKRGVSALRREFRGLLAEWRERGHGDGEAARAFVRRYEAMSVQIRTHLDLARVRSLLAEHEELVSDLRRAMAVESAQGALPRRSTSVCETEICSPSSEHQFVHYRYTNHPPKSLGSPLDAGLQESVAEGPAPEAARPSPGQGSASEHVSLPMAVGAASERLAARLPVDPGWSDLVEAAYQTRSDLGVSQASWGEACEQLGRYGAAVCLLVADRAALREVDPVRCPPAYFRGMVRKAQSGELRLHASVFGLLERS